MYNNTTTFARLCSLCIVFFQIRARCRAHLRENLHSPLTHKPLWLRLISQCMGHATWVQTFLPLICNGLGHRLKLDRLPRRHEDEQSDHLGLWYAFYGPHSPRPQPGSFRLNDVDTKGVLPLHAEVSGRSSTASFNESISHSIGRIASTP